MGLQLQIGKGHVDATCFTTKASGRREVGGDLGRESSRGEASDDFRVGERSPPLSEEKKKKELQNWALHSAAMQQKAIVGGAPMLVGGGFRLGGGGGLVWASGGLYPYLAVYYTSKTGKPYLVQDSSNQLRDINL